MCFPSDDMHGMIPQTVKADSHAGFPLNAKTLLLIKAEELAEDLIEEVKNRGLQASSRLLEAATQSTKSLVNRE